MARRRVAVLFERLGPYHLARIRACTDFFDPVAVEFFGVDSTYAWDRVPGDHGFQRRTVLPEETRSAGPVMEGVSGVLDAVVPDVVAIPGWSHPGALGAMEWCVRRGKPFVLMADSFSHEARIGIRQWTKERIVALAGAALVAGSVHRSYLEALGMPRERVFTGYDVVDNRHFDRGRPGGDPGSPRGSCFLTVSRFIPEKNLVFLLDAYARYAAGTTGGELPLLIVGDGPEREALEARIRALGLESKVRLPGFKQYGELPALYAGARAFVLPSVSETWGLAVNEAMASGIPVLVSTACGCVTDLVREGVNGYTFDPRDEVGLARRLHELGSDGVRAAALGEAGRDIIQSWTPELFGRNLAAACDAAAGGGVREAGPIDRLALKALALATRASRGWPA